MFRYLLTFTLFFAFTFNLFSQDYWSVAGENEITASKPNTNYLRLDRNAFDSQIKNASPTVQGRQSTVLIPNEKGVLERFSLEPVSVLSAELSKRFPKIKTFIGWSESRPNVKMRMSSTPMGVSVWLRLPDGDDFFIQPVNNNKQFHYAYLKDKSGNTIPFECKTEIHETHKNEHTETSVASRQQASAFLKTYRLAVASTGEYTNYWGDDDDTNGTNSEDALAAVVSTINRVNEVFETDFQVRLELVSDASLLYPDEATDPFTTNLNSELQSTLNNITIFGAANYDVGHLFAYGSANGNAGCIGCICVDSSKGSAFSSHPFVDSFGGPFDNDYFDVDYVAHELGHQFGAYHTFSFQTEGTGVNAEPGSGSTIMGYAGITGGDDVQQHSDPYFHYFSIQNVRNHIDNEALCAVETLISESVPSVEAGDDFTIPKTTPYELKASINNEAGYKHTYNWEQLDSGQSGSSNFGPTATSGPQLRSVAPVLSNKRMIPNTAQVLTGELTQTNPSTASSWETLSSVGRTMNWGVTLRSVPQTSIAEEGTVVAQDTRQITIASNAGPFVVQSQQSAGLIWEGGSRQTIQWDVANTDIAPVNTATVSIYLSEDGGLTYPIELITGTPNDGEEKVDVPNTLDIAQARLKIIADNSIYYTINAVPFAVTKRAFIVQFESAIQSVCGVDSATFNFTLNRYLGFDDTVQLALENIPDGVTASLSQDSFGSGESVGSLTLSGLQSIADGDYSPLIKGVGGSFEYEFQIELYKRDQNVAPPTLLSPQNNEEEAGLDTPLTWEMDSNIDEVRIQVASNSEFTDPIVDFYTTKNNYLVTGLESDTVYYWRIAARNLCLNSDEFGDFSETRQFKTSLVSCVSNAAQDLPKNLIDGSTTSVGRIQSSIVVRENLPILDINVLVDITHTWISDLELTLVSPGGEQILLAQNHGGDNTSDYTNTVFDQEATQSIATSSYPFTGSYQPVESLETLYGTNSYGTWTLYVDDEYSQDTGTLNTFELDFCLEGKILPNSDNDSFVDVLDNCPTITNENQQDSDGNGIGDVCDIFAATNITVNKRDASCVSKNNGLLTISAFAHFTYQVSVQGDNGFSYNDTFTQSSVATVNDVPSGNYTICVTSEEDPSFERCFNTAITEPEALGVQAVLNHDDQLLSLDLSGSDEYTVRLNGKEHKIQNTNRAVFQLEEEWTSLEVSTPLNCQGIHTQWINLNNDSVVFPNPVIEDATVLFPANASGIILLHSSQGELLWSSEVRSPSTSTSPIMLPMRSYSSGVYVVTIQRENLTETFKIIKR